MQKKNELRRMETGFGITNANFPMDEKGCTYHVGVKRGEVANRVVSVGDPQRAAVLAGMLEHVCVNLATNRGFHTYTGLYRGTPVSVVATGMGIPMMDFVVRECSAVTDGEMLFVRFGTCGTVDGDLPIGRVCVSSEGSVLCRRNEDAWLPGSSEPPYVFSKTVAADKELSDALFAQMQKSVGHDKVVHGLNCTADSFYSSQGRLTADFEDRNEDVIESVRKHFPACKTLEMETFQLFHLAHCSRSHRIRASAACIVLANRVNNTFLGHDDKRHLEQEGGRAVLEALISVPLTRVMDTPECAWKKKN